MHPYPSTLKGFLQNKLKLLFFFSIMLITIRQLCSCTGCSLTCLMIALEAAYRGGHSVMQMMVASVSQDLEKKVSF